MSVRLVVEQDDSLVHEHSGHAGRSSFQYDLGPRPSFSVIQVYRRLQAPSTAKTNARKGCISRAAVPPVGVPGFTHLVPVLFLSFALQHGYRPSAHDPHGTKLLHGGQRPVGAGIWRTPTTGPLCNVGKQAEYRFVCHEPIVLGNPDLANGPGF